MKNLQPHIRIRKGQISPFVLLPGDPGRVEVIGRKLKNFSIQSANREFKIGTGTYKNIPVTVCSTGIGGPSIAIAVEELINAGAKILIRVGTCGGAWRKDIPLGSLIIATESVRDDGTTREYVPEKFPAVADVDIVQALVSAAIQEKQKYFVGIVRTHDAFYSRRSVIKKYSAIRILASEMESAPLFVVASLRGVKAGAILAVNAKPERRDQIPVAEFSVQKTTEVVDDMINVALKAILLLQKNHSGNQSS